jgi:hypothetical protein
MKTEADQRLDFVAGLGIALFAITGASRIDDAAKSTGRRGLTTSSRKNC